MAPAKSKASDLSSTPHPPYFQMICEAISSLKERTGSSQQAISKFIEEKYSGTLPPNFNKLLSVQLKRFVKSEKLVKVKNSFKTAATEKAKSLKKKTDAVENNEKNAAKKITSNAVKTKPLDGVKTPDILKKKKKAEKGAKGSATVTKKMKRLSQVKTPEAMKKAPTPVKRKASKSAISSRPPLRKR
ncbi:histone H1-like [Vitis riparia]|uniref:histone H1-like n=1 Tax=Vitis riparia TaxID=96939 RepID=UPI00155B0DB1|nr:histone H1-like [Vitis riparia]